MQKKLKSLNNFAEANCNKCELRAGCHLANPDWEKAKKDYPCFYPSEELRKEVIDAEFKKESWRRAAEHRKEKLIEITILIIIALTQITTMLLVFLK